MVSGQLEIEPGPASPFDVDRGYTIREIGKTKKTRPLNSI